MTSLLAMALVVVGVKPRLTFAPPGSVRVGGLIGERWRGNVARLLAVDEDELLDGFRRRPGKQAWIGEHVGKWLHGASLTYMDSKDARLLAKMKRVAAGLIATQEADGYLGTYAKGRRLEAAGRDNWDVWTHKYDLIGLLAYHRATGDSAALMACRRVGDLLMAHFGPGKANLFAAGEHLGMAATSVLEPVVGLYRATSDPKVLAFARWIVDQMDDPKGPHALRDLAATGSVRRTANAKAYEMLSNFNGLLDLYEVTGDESLLRPVLTAWRDVASHRLYLTGTGSSHEYWTETDDQPNDPQANVGETCVSVSWMQVNLRLQRLTGEGRFGDEIERTVYNHLFAAQRPDGAAWCYYTPLQGAKSPGSSTNCCLSSGPRGVAAIPTAMYGVRDTPTPTIVVNLFGASTAEIPTAKGLVRLRQITDYPFGGAVDIRVERAPKGGVVIEPRGFEAVKRVLHDGQSTRLRLDVGVRRVEGRGSNADHEAFTAGPLVLARTGPHVDERAPLGLTLRPAGRGRWTGVDATDVFLPFADAGRDGAKYRVWIPTVAAR